MATEEEIARRTNALIAKLTLHFGRKAEMLEAANARMADCVQKLEVMHATQLAMRATFDRLEKKC